MHMIKLFGKPIKVLIFAGAFNGFILAFSLGILLVAATQPRIMNGYKHPKIYLLLGALVAILLFYFGGLTMVAEIQKALRTS